MGFYDDLPFANIFFAQSELSNDWYDQMLGFLTKGVLPESMTKNQRRKLALKTKLFFVIAEALCRRSIGQVIRRCVPDFE